MAGATSEQSTLSRTLRRDARRLLDSPSVSEPSEFDRLAARVALNALRLLEVEQVADPEPLDARHREALSELGETLASALHHKNIGRDIRGWSEVSEALSQVKAMLDGTWFGPDDDV